MKLFVRALLCFLTALAASAAVSPDLVQIVRSAEEITLWSLHPDDLELRDAQGKLQLVEGTSERLHGFPILGQLTPQDPAVSQSIRTAVIAAIELPPREDRASSMCFKPRYAVSLGSGRRRIDLLLCFECNQGHAFYREAGVEKKVSFSVGDNGRTTLNELLDTRKIRRNIPSGEVKSPIGR